MSRIASNRGNTSARGECASCARIIALTVDYTTDPAIGTYKVRRHKPENSLAKVDADGWCAGSRMPPRTITSHAH